MSDSATEHTSQLERDLMAATVFVYGFFKLTVKDEKNGGEKESNDFRIFTATAFEREGDIYRFVTAAHCIGDDDKMCQNAMSSLPPASIIIGLDKNSLKNKDGVFEARLVAIGQLSKGEDFAVLEAKINRPLPTVPLADRDPEIGEEVSNVASPISLGKTLLRGYAANISTSQNSYTKGLNIYDVENFILFNLMGASGSSGSVIASHSLQSIVAILVVIITPLEIKTGFSQMVLALPISRFRDFWTRAKAHRKTVQILQVKK